MTLGALLEQQRHGFDELIDLLRQEQDLLVNGRAADGSALTALAEAKQLCFRSLESLEQARRAQQRQAGQPDDGGAELARQSNCLPLWQQLQDRARRARHMNLLNGSLIHQGLRHNQRVLDALRQLTGSPLYDAQGQQGKTGSRLQSRA